MKVAAIKNHPAEGLGYFEEVFENKGIDYYYIEAYKETRVGDFDALVILGGPMGVYEAEMYPFLRWEMNLIRKNYKNKPVLGVCLGAQLIAAALGERVYPYIKEIGWRKVKKVSDRFPLPDTTEVFQWHGDTFDLPAGAELVYAGDEVRNQCFVTEKAIAVQFHVEITLELIEKWTSDPKARLSEEERKKILEESREKIENHNKLCEKFVDLFLKV